MLTARHGRCRGRGSNGTGTVPPVGAALAPVRWLVLASGADPVLGRESESTDRRPVRCEVTIARSGPQLLRLAQQCRPDVAVLADVVADRDLIGLCAQLRQQCPRCRS
jgi:CheY-like chemotaxis protein